jgi:hypothetical protein
MEGEKNTGDWVDIDRLGRDQRGETQQKQDESGDRRVAEKSGEGQVAIDEGDWDPERLSEKTKQPMDVAEDLGEDREKDSITGIGDDPVTESI